MYTRHKMLCGGGHRSPGKEVSHPDTPRDLMACHICTSQRQSFNHSPNQSSLCLSLFLVVLVVHLRSPFPSGSYLNFLSEVRPRTPTTLVTVQGVRRSGLYQTACDLEPHNPQRRIMTSGDASTHLKKVYCCPYIQG